MIDLLPLSYWMRSPIPMFHVNMRGCIDNQSCQVNVTIRVYVSRVIQRRRALPPGLQTSPRRISSCFNSKPIQLSMLKLPNLQSPRIALSFRHCSQNRHSLRSINSPALRMASSSTPPTSQDPLTAGLNAVQDESVKRLKYIDVGPLGPTTHHNAHNYTEAYVDRHQPER